MTPDSQHGRFVLPDGTSLTCFEMQTGAGENGPAVVFSPGNGFPAQVYRPIFDALEYPCTVYGINPRGFGGSDVPEGYLGWDSLVADLREFVDRRVGGPVVMVGHSLGAMMSHGLAVERPGLATGLVLMEPIIRAVPGQPWPPPRVLGGRSLVELTKVRQEKWPSLDSARRFLAENLAYRDWASPPREEFLDHGLTAIGDGKVKLACPPMIESDIYANDPGHRQFDWARLSPCPAVVMQGRDSVAVEADAMQAFVDAFPMASLFTLEGSHTFPMEHPRDTARALERALRMVDGETGGWAIKDGTTDK